MHTQQIVVGTALVFLSAVASPGQSPVATDKAEVLWEATRKGDASTVNKLLDEGVDVNTKFRYGATALSYACDRGHLEVVKVLLEHGADVNVTDTFYGRTPLTWAVSPAMARKPQHAEIVGLLLKYGAEGKENALMVAVSTRDPAMTTIVLEEGHFSRSTLSEALESAKKGGYQDIVTLLEQAGAQPRVELADEAQLARYAGTYRSTGGAELVLAVMGGRLIAGPAQRLTFIARDETTFWIVELPGVTVTFRLEDGKAIALTISRGRNTTTYSRVENR